ncbi:MAG: hypothetical protein AAF602_06985 [Myxococcota bacterium]
MKTSTPLSFLLAAGLAISLYATPWALMWVLDLAPPEFGIDTLPPVPDATFVEITLDGLEDADDLDDDAIDVDGEVEDPDAEVVDDPAPAAPETENQAEGTAEGDDQPSGEEGVEGEGPRTVAAGGPEGTKRKQVRRRRRRPPQCRVPHPHVRKADDGVMEIDRVFVERMTKNLKTFMSLGYSRAYREEGVKGWYISGFGCTSPVFKAGFRRKDVLLTVNGKRTRTVTGVFLLYLKLKKQSSFEVQLMRRGKPKTLKFRVVSS